jgi:hypothetical protein
MTPQATFLISFDCEGKWGIADHVSAQDEEVFLNTRLNHVYQRLIELLARYELKATFAFVGAFIMSEEAYREHEADFTAHPDPQATAWIQPFLKDMRQQRSDGWLNPDLLSIVASRPEHEIGAHGFTHQALGNSLISREGFLHEMECLKKFPIFQRDDLTIVYPRHVVGYTDLLPRYGVIGYRESLHGDATLPTVRMLNMLDEVNIFQTAQQHAEPANPVPIPSGFLLNWRAGIRKKIPFQVTQLRWKNLIQQAIKTNRVVHLWSHPHNFINGDRMFELLESIFDQIAVARERGRICVRTQREYATQSSTTHA